MSISPKKIQSIQQNKSKDKRQLTPEELDETARFCLEKPYEDRSSYYPTNPVSEIIPECYLNIQFNKFKMENYSDETLFYIFYSFPSDNLQLQAYKTLLSRKYFYSKTLDCFVQFAEPPKIDHKKHEISVWDHVEWCKTNREVTFNEHFMNALEK